MPSVTRHRKFCLVYPVTPRPQTKLFLADGVTLMDYITLITVGEKLADPVGHLGIFYIF